MCCVDWGFVVCSSSWRRSAKPLLHSFQGSNPKNGKGKCFDYYFYYIIFILCIVPFEWFSYFKCHYVAKKNYFKFRAACLTTWSSGTEHCHGKSNLEKLGCCNLVYKKTWPAIKFQVWKMKSVLLLQIVMVSPSTHLVKNHEFRPITNQLQIKKKKEPYLGLYVTRQLIWRQMPKLFITVNWLYIVLLYI